MKIIKYILILLILPFFSSSFAATYYIDYNAVNDSANGTAKSTPWKRHPYMNGFSGTYNHSAGDQFIFKGGVTWPASTTIFNIQAGGTEGNVDYYGVDQTWYSGASWSRPIITCGNGSCGHDTINIMIAVESGIGYVTIDNFELTGQRILTTDTTAECISLLTGSNHIILQNLYIHGWSHGAGDFGMYGVPFHIVIGDSSSSTGNTMQNCTIDGSDTSQDMAIWVYNGLDKIKNNTVQYTQSGVDQGCVSEFSGNEFSHSVASLGASAHCNVFQNQQACTGGWKIYNNYIHDVTSSAAMAILVYPNGPEMDIFNNVFWNTNVQPIVIDGSQSSSEIVKIYNNTGSAPSGNACIRVTGSIDTLYQDNNHCITDTGVITIDGSITNYYPGSNNLTQTVAQANAQDYISAHRYAPQSGTGSTVDSGATITCSGCGSGISKDILAVSRPQGASWDIGAYEYVSTGGATLSPSGAPANLGADGGVVTLGP